MIIFRSKTDAAFGRIAFLVLFASMAACFAWLGFNRLDAARDTGRFEYLWHGIGQENWPLLFSILKIFLMLWIGAACFMTLFGVVWLCWEIWRKFR